MSHKLNQLYTPEHKNLQLDRLGCWGLPKSREECVFKRSSDQEMTFHLDFQLKLVLV